MAKKDDAATDAPAEQPQKAEIITVKSTLKPEPDGGNPVALYEKHPDHPKANEADPEGEAYVAGPNPVKVAKTPAVLKKLSEGVLEEVK